MTKGKGRRKGDDVFYEQHHILPSSLGGSDDSDNLVLLTPEEHYVAHQLLIKIYPGNLRMIKAAVCMATTNNTVGCCRVNNKYYGWIKRKIHEEHMSRRPVINCKVCGKEFNVNPSSGEKAQYCSYECSSKGRRTGEYLPCKVCDKPIYHKKSLIKKGIRYHTCSKECRLKKTKWVDKTCLQCGEEFTVRKVYEFRKFCSRKCTDVAKKLNPTEEMIAARNKNKIKSRK